MESYWLLNEAGKARHDELMREAARARRFLGSKKRSRLAALLQGVMLLFG